jgi:hypothetical protein
MHTGREWIDYVSYCADFPESYRLFITRVERSGCADFFSMITNRMHEFRVMVEEARELIRG